MRLVFMGTPTYAVPVLEALNQAKGTELAAVYTPPDRPRGRGRELEVTPVKGSALNMGLPVYQPVSLRPARVWEELASLKPEVIVVAAYGKLVPAEVLAIPPHGCLNIHPSLLPKYRGPSPVVTAILDGSVTTGVTLMLLDEGMDTGAILAQRERILEGTETAGELTGELFELGTGLLLESLEPWMCNQLKATPQDDSLATITKKLERSEGRVDWTLSATELARRQRAFTPWPGLFTRWQSKSLRLLEAVAFEASGHPGHGSNARPGEVVDLFFGDIAIGIGTADGILGVKTLQLEGRRATTAAEFLRGYPEFPGTVLD